MGALFLKLGWDRCGFHRKCVKTRYTELIFLHPVGFAVHIVHFGAPRASNVDALFFMLGWHKMHGETRYVELVFCIGWDLLVT
jgi:hypothetical protein